MRPLNTTFCCAGFCTDGLNVQFVHRTSKLRFAFAASGIFIVDPEDTGFVAIERQWLTMHFNIAPCRFKIGESRFRFYETKLHQTTGGVINVNQCCTLGSPVFKPVMVAAVNLYEFTGTGTSVTRLLDFWRTLLTWNPKTGLSHQLTNRFFGNMNAVNLSQFFTGQSRTEIVIAFANNIQRVCGQSLRQLIIAGFTTTAAGHAKRTIFTITRKQTTALAVGDTKPLRCHLCCQTPVDDVRNNLESVNFIQSEKLRCESRHGNPYLIIHRTS
ncbi:Uncharacterised protein [Salmonella enterica subsp. enterica serovar Typhi]|nr:Uncharacterised protein [Salmonella enterica subsp. enterica serovar Typhi]